MPHYHESDQYPTDDDEWNADEEADYLADEEDAAEEIATDQVLIIPGEGLPPAYGPLRRRKRPLTMQVLLITIIACLIAGIAFSFTPLADVSEATVISPFGALVNTVNLSNANGWVSYRARSGDTFASIATAFGLTTPNGIFELNHLTSTDEAQIGQVYKIPTDPTYGATYTPPLPAGLNQFGTLYPLTNLASPGNASQFSAVAGATNGTGGNCVTGWESIQASGDITQYHLINPDQPAAGSPLSQWRRGFIPPSRLSLPHDGADISTGVLGTPIYAAQAGQVIFAHWDNGGGGNSIKINHCGGLATSYSHLDRMVVSLGANVTQGQLIGYQGDTGQSMGTHVHYMLWWHNTPIDPLCAYTAANKLDGYSLDTDPAQRPPYGGCPPNLTPSVWLVH